LAGAGDPKDAPVGSDDVKNAQRHELGYTGYSAPIMPPDVETHPARRCGAESAILWMRQSFFALSLEKALNWEQIRKWSKSELRVLGEVDSDLQMNI
jgi:hypothetical protein